MYFYSISYPSDWIVDEDIINDILIGIPTDVTNKFVLVSGMQIQVDKVSVDSTPMQFLESKKAEHSQFPGMQNWTITSTSEILTGSNITGYKFDYSCIENTEKKVGLGVAIKKGGYAYYAQFESIESRWETIRDTAKACIDSFSPPGVFTGSYTNTDFKFSLSLPSEWSIVETKIPNRPVFFSPPYNQPAVVGEVNLEVISPNITAKEYALTLANQLLSNSNYRLVQQGDFIFNNGENGYEVQIIAPTGSITMKVRLIALVQGSNAYRLIFTGRDTYQDTQAGSINQLAKSFSISQ